MKIKFVLCLALLLSAGCAGYCLAEIVETSPQPGQSLEILWDQNFPDKKLEEIDQWSRYWRADFWTPYWVGKFQRLPGKNCNEIAVAAARELSVCLENGKPITAATVEKLGHQFPVKDTPEEAAFRRLDDGNTLRIQILSGLAQLRLISDSRVIGPLVEMLDYPSNSFLNFIFFPIRGNGQGVAPILCKLTGCEYYDLDRYEAGEKHAEFVKGWRDWLARNRNTSLIFDPNEEQIVKDRVATIELQIREDMGPTFSLNHLMPQSVRIMPMENKLFEDGIDTYMMQQIIFNNYCLNITVEIDNPPLPPPKLLSPRPEYQPPLRQLLREAFPDTDIFIKVDAASTNRLFMKQLGDSLAELPPPPDSAAAAEQEWETLRSKAVARLSKQVKDENGSYQAAAELAELEEYTPIVEALSSTNREIQQRAIMGLAGAPLLPSASTNANAAATLLIHLLQNSDSYTRYLAAWALSRVHDEDAATVNALIAAAGDTNSQTCVTAIESLGEFKSQARVIVPVLKQIEAGTNSGAAMAAKFSLNELTPYLK